MKYELVQCAGHQQPHIVAMHLAEWSSLTWVAMVAAAVMEMVAEAGCKQGASDHKGNA